MNSHDMLALLRDSVFEGTASHWSDLNLMRRLNVSQRKIAVRVAMTSGQWLLKSVSVTPVASVITLPADCSKPIYLEETSSGRVIDWLSSVGYRRVSRAIGSDWDVGSREAYPLRNTIEVNIASYTTVCTLWYQVRVPDLQQGTAKAGAVTSLTLPDDRVTKRIADYYNGVSIEIISGTGTAGLDTISDYTSTMIATVTGTYGVTTVFGTISMLPEELHPLIVADATVNALLKPSSSFDKDALAYYKGELRDMRKDLFGWLESRVPGGEGTEIGDPY